MQPFQKGGFFAHQVHSAGQTCYLKQISGSQGLPLLPVRGDMAFRGTLQYAYIKNGTPVKNNRRRGMQKGTDRR